MFYYLGRKKRIAHMYPEPLLTTIIEPFAGSAAYSLHGLRWQNNVIIADANPDVIGVWRYLQTASSADILGLPTPSAGERLSAYELTPSERWLMAFHVNPGANQRTDVVTRFNRWPAGRRYIAANLHKIRHWTVLLADYRDIPNMVATWFVDPPYERAGKHYMVNTVDFATIGAWCRSRQGQLIVCEQHGAAWLPFEPLADIAICGTSRSQEAVFVSYRPELAAARRRSKTY